MSVTLYGACKKQARGNYSLLLLLKASSVGSRKRKEDVSSSSKHNSISFLLREEESWVIGDTRILLLVTMDVGGAHTSGYAWLIRDSFLLLQEEEDDVMCLGTTRDSFIPLAHAYSASLWHTLTALAFGKREESLVVNVND